MNTHEDHITSCAYKTHHALHQDRKYMSFRFPVLWLFARLLQRKAESSTSFELFKICSSPITTHFPWLPVGSRKFSLDNTSSRKLVTDYRNEHMTLTPLVNYYNHTQEAADNPCFLGAVYNLTSTRKSSFLSFHYNSWYMYIK
jgi:hypothetical protein